jgi:hypothetical protein
MKRIFIAAALLAGFQFSGAVPCAAGANMDVTIEDISGGGGNFNPLYRVSGSQVSLDIQNNSFQNDPFAKYSISGSMFGRPMGFNNSIQNDTFGGTSSVIVDSDGFYAKFSKQSGWPELRVDTRVDQNADPRTVVLFSVLANYLPAIPGASSSGGASASQSYTIRQFGDSVQVDGPGLSNVRVERQNYTYTVHGSGFGKNFDGADRLVLELDSAFLGAGGLRISGCGMDLEVKRDDFGGPRLGVRGTAGDSSPVAAFSMALARYLNGANRAR